MIVRIAFLLFVGFGVASAQTQATPEREPYRDPQWATVQGALLPGSVHMQNEQENRGIAYLAVALLGATFASGVAEVPFLDDADFSRAIGVTAWGVGALVSAYEAHEIVDTLNRENGYDLELDVRAGPDPTFRVALFGGRF